MASFSVQIRRMLNPGVVAIANRRSAKAANGWAGSKSIHPHRLSVRHKLHLNIAEHYDVEAQRLVK